MIRRIARLFSFELSKVLRWRYLWFSLLVAALGCVLASVVPEHLHNDRNAELTGYTLMAILAHYAVFPVGTVLAVVFAAMVPGQEYVNRTLPAVLSMPVRRFELLAAKFLVVLAYLAVLVVFIFAVSFALTLGLHGFETIRFDRYTTISLATVWPHFLYAALFSLVPLVAVSACVMMLAVLFESSSVAIAVAVTLGLLLQVLDLFSLSFAYTLTAHLGEPTSLLLNIGEQIHVEWLQELKPMFAVCGGYTVVSLAVLAFVFSRRDVT